MGRKRAHDGDEEGGYEEHTRKKVKTELLSSDDVQNEFDPHQVDDSVRKKVKKEHKKKRENHNESHRGDAVEVPEKPQYRKVQRKINLSRAMEIISFEDAKNLILTKPKCGLKMLREKRHVTLPYHLIGGNILNSCEFIAKMTVGKYRSKVRGVVLSVGSVRLASLPRVIDDQSVFHVDASITQVVFRPVVGHHYEARVTHIAADFLSALILDVVTITAPVDDKLREKLRGITLEVDDIIKVKHSGITIRRGMCQLRGKFMKIVSKGIAKASHGNEADDQKPVVRLNKRTTFDDEPDDEGEE
ncbi:hypothetical protein Q1695_014897 [Nippostrongylus brasiliensis]|nr:hypothetical protein Q1695_014897 [Nippostrongylus brasiliensis]